MNGSPWGSAPHSRQGARAGVLLQLYGLPQGRKAAGWIPSNVSLTTICRARLSTLVPWT